jgi:hypothetical protein
MCKTPETHETHLKGRGCLWVELWQPSPNPAVTHALTHMGYKTPADHYSPPARATLTFDTYQNWLIYYIALYK